MKQETTRTRFTRRELLVTVPILALGALCVTSHARITEEGVSDRPKPSRGTGCGNGPGPSSGACGVKD